MQCQVVLVGEHLTTRADSISTNRSIVASAGVFSAVLPRHGYLPPWTKCRIDDQEDLYFLIITWFTYINAHLSIRKPRLLHGLLEIMESLSAGTKPQPTSGEPQSLTFLPVNQHRSPSSQRARRGYQSCDNCREKKKRCEPSPDGDSCLRCQLDSRDCSTTYKRKRRKMRPHAGSTANASGVIPVSQSHAFHPAPDDSGNNLHTRSDFLPRALNAKEQILSTKLLDAQDALDLIAVAGSKDGASEASLSLERTQPAPTHQYTLDSPAPTPIASSWKHFFLVRRGIIRANEATEYFDFYFSYLWHVFPVVPQWYSSPDRYGSLVAEEPVLAMGLIMTASRYHPLSGLNGHARSERIHWRTWPWFQRVLQSSMWGSPVMRKLGSVAALLLLIEWHPRAINSPEDLVGDCSEIELFDPQGQPYEADTRESTEHDQLPESSSIPERLNVIAPAYRSNKMSRLVFPGESTHGPSSPSFLQD